MKISSIVLCGLLLCSTVVQSMYNCALRYDKRAYMAWYDFGSNLIYGMYNDPPPTVKECPRCDTFGNKMAELHYSVIDLEDQRTFWMNKNNITGARLFEMLTRLLQVYPLFSNFFTLA